MVKLIRVINGARRTGDEGRTIMIRCISDSQENLSDCPVSFVEIEVMVCHIDNGVSDGSAEDFCTIKSGLHEAKNGNRPTKSCSSMYGKTARDDRPIRFIQAIFLLLIYLSR